MPKFQDISTRLEQHLFRFDCKPNKPVTLLRFMGHPICTVGNISNIQGPAKSAKSAVLGAMMAATVKALAGIQTENDAEQMALLGFACDLKPDPDQSVILHFDTEQSAYDHHQHVWNALQRMGAELANTSQLPLLSYSLLEFSAREREEAIRSKIESLRKDGRKFPCIFLDGVADIVSDPNNFEESAKLVDWFHRLAGENQCTVITVLHENPSATDSGSGKTRGHLGSQIERKSETNLRVAKDRMKNQQGVLENLETSTIWADRARHCHIPRAQGIQIRWDPKAKLHVVQSRSATPGSTARIVKQSTAVEKVAEEEAVINGIPEDVRGFLEKNLSTPLKSTELAKRIERQFKVGTRTAKDRIKTWEAAGWIRKPGLRAAWEFVASQKESLAEETVTTDQAVETAGSAPEAITAPPPETTVPGHFKTLQQQEAEVEARGVENGQGAIGAENKKGLR